MALRNAFENLATESTVSEISKESTLAEILSQEAVHSRELYEKILMELKMMNIQLSMITGTELTTRDINLGELK